MKTALKTKWSKPYCNTQHMGVYGTQRHWVTVVDYDGCAELSCWFPGCAFSPKVKWFPSVEEARKAGEAYMDSVA